MGVCIKDWNEWCRKNHIKLKGEGNDNRKNACGDRAGVRRTDMAPPGSGNGRSTGNCDLQIHERGRPVRQQQRRVQNKT